MLAVIRSALGVVLPMLVALVLSRGGGALLCRASYVTPTPESNDCSMRRSLSSPTLTGTPPPTHLDLPSLDLLQRSRSYTTPPQSDPDLFPPSDEHNLPRHTIRLRPYPPISSYRAARQRSSGDLLPSVTESSSERDDPVDLTEQESAAITSLFNIEGASPRAAVAEDDGGIAEQRDQDEASELAASEPESDLDGVPLVADADALELIQRADHDNGTEITALELDLALVPDKPLFPDAAPDAVESSLQPDQPFFPDAAKSLQPDLSLVSDTAPDAAESLQPGLSLVSDAASDTEIALQPALVSDTAESSQQRDQVGVAVSEPVPVPDSVATACSSAPDASAADPEPRPSRLMSGTWPRADGADARGLYGTFIDAGAVHWFETTELMIAIGTALSVAVALALALSVQHVPGMMMTTPGLRGQVLLAPRTFTYRTRRGRRLRVRTDVPSLSSSSSIEVL